MKTISSILILAAILFAAATANAQEIISVATAGNLEKVKELVVANPQVVNARDSLSRTPLHWACRGVHYEVLKYLVDKGADVNARDVNGITPLASVTARNHLDAVRYLLDRGAKTEEADNLQSAPILYALSPESKEILALLIQKGASLEVENDYQRTPLLLACRERGSIDIVKLLVENGAKINVRDRFGDTPLTLAAWRGFEEIVNYLLDHHAEFSTSGPDGIDLLSYALDKRLWRLFEAMVLKGGDSFMLEMMENPVLHQAAAGGSEKITQDLIDRRFQINAKDFYGWTPLHYASYFGRTDVAGILLNKGADINSKTPLGESPCDLARSENKEEIMNLLAAKGANPAIPEQTQLSGPYFGQAKPGSSPVLFAPGIISRLKGGHSNVIFSPDGCEALWTEWILRDVGYSAGCIVWYSKLVKGFWTMPKKIMPVGDTPFYSTDGKRIYFLASLPLPPENTEVKRIWYFEPTKKNLGNPKPLDFDVAGNGLYWQFSFDQDENIYFSTDEGLFRSVCRNGKYQPREKLSDLFGPEYQGGSPFIAPDGSYLIFNSMDLPGSFGSMDLYIGYKKPDGTWTKPVNMGPSVNSAFDEMLPMVSRDGKYLFMRTRRNGISGAYWMDAKIIEELRPKKYAY